MKRFIALVVAVGALSSVALAFAAVPGQAPSGATQPAGSSVTIAVGPGASETVVLPPSPSASPRSIGPSTAQATQIITGTVASKAGIALGPSGQPTYIGTERAAMTVTNVGSDETVTVVPG